MPVVHYLNLTNGLLCRHLVHHPHYLRLQSTWCEQKRWWPIMHDLGPDFLMHAAMGYDVVVHDTSETKPMPRAVYQGLSWVRYALNRRWMTSGEHPAYNMRAYVRGVDCTRYFEMQYQCIERADKSLLDYYKRHLRLPKEGVRLWHCSEWPSAHEEDTLNAPTRKVDLPRHRISHGDDEAVLDRGDG